MACSLSGMQKKKKKRGPEAVRRAKIMSSALKMSKLNCEILHDDLAFEARWAVAGDSIVIQLVAKLEKGEYMSFGVSGQIDRNTMIGGDVVVAWIDHETLNGFAYDYYLDAKSQCAGSRGSCPDVKLRANTESIRLLNAALVNGYSIVTYQRPLRAHDELDLPIFTNGSQAVIWAIGPLNSLQEVSYHSITSKKPTLIDFGRSPQWNCPIPESDASIANSETNENYDTNPPPSTTEPTRTRTESTALRTRRPTSEVKEPEVVRTTTKKVEATPAPVKREKPWDIPPIQCDEPDDGIFYAQMGPTGGKHGYSAITGHVGWGVSWYINGLLIPVINVVRGRTYTFVTEGGYDPEIPAKYHPFYITDDPVGGYHYKTPEERAKVRVFAGVMQTKPGELVPTGVGRLCSWTPDPEQPPSDDFASFGAYQRTLSLVCDNGEPGFIQWTPDENTPDTVYYQCFTHRYLGWKINVHDNCDKEAAASEQISSRVQIEDDSGEQVEGELQSRPSIQVVTRVKPMNTSSVGNEIPTAPKESGTTYVFSSPIYKDTYKTDFTEVEQQMLQDPYMPPRPYQKNFDYSYQSIETTEPMKEMKTITEKSFDHLDYSKPMKTHVPHFNNFSSTINPTLITSKVKIPYSHRDPYPFYKTPLPISTSSKHHAPPMHIHFIKHADHAPDMMPVPAQKSFVVGRPNRHSMMMKKPITKPIPFSYAPRVTKIPKLEPQVASSINVKNILAPPLRDTIPKAPQGMLVSYYTPTQQPKKAYYVPSRKREEPKPQYFPGKLDEFPEPKFNGFNPNSIVIEGGFKPIIPSTESQQVAQNAAQERMSEDNEEYVEQDLKDIVSSTENTTKVKTTDEHSKNPFEGKQPVLFEPIFIPSPVISEEQRKKKPEERPAIENHKVDPNIVYIWPAAETSGNPQIKDTRFSGYFSSSNTIPSPYYKGTEKGESNSNENVVDAYPSILTKPVNEATHEYKVTEIFDNVNAEVSEANNATDRIISLSSEVEDDQNAEANSNSNHKVKYIPVSYTTKDTDSENENKFIITIPDEESTESVNSTIIKL